MISDIKKNLQGAEMYLCAKFGCSNSFGLGRVHRQRIKHTDGNSLYYSKYMGMCRIWTNLEVLLYFIVEFP